MYVALLLVSIATSLYGVGAQDDQLATLAFIRQGHETLDQLQPKFLAEATPEAREQFHAIISDKSLTIAQIGDKLNGWAAQQGQQIQAQFEAAKEKLESTLAKVKEAIEQSSLSNAAKQAFDEIAKIAANKDQTAAQQLQQIKAIMDSLPESVSNEMTTYMKSNVRTALENVKSEVQ